VKPEQNSFPTRHLFPAKTVFSVLRFLTRLLRRLEFRDIIKDSEGKRRRKRLVLRDLEQVTGEEGRIC
jgi:hypothetical protein